MGLFMSRSLFRPSPTSGWRRYSLKRTEMSKHLIVAAAVSATPRPHPALGCRIRAWTRARIAAPNWIAETLRRQFLQH